MPNSSSYDIEILTSSDSLDEWDRFVDESPQGSIFCRSWWLRSVCTQGFQIFIFRQHGRILAGMPLPIYHFRGFTRIHMPPLTQVLGALLAPINDGSYTRKLSNEMNVLTALANAIPRFHVFGMNFHYNFTNWLPFYWAGYTQTTRYTYIIPDLTDLNKVYAEFASSTRTSINKARNIVSVHTDLSARDLYDNHVLTLQKKGEQILYDFDYFKAIYETAHQTDCGKTWYAMDEHKNIHAAIFVIFDRKSAYGIVCSTDPDFRSSGAGTLLQKEAITYVAKYTQRWDFEGSMIHDVENYYRKFGAIQTPYFTIMKDNRSLPVRSIAAGKNLLVSKTKNLKQSLKRSF
ncbi:methicillin resistance protein [candidate division KSB1 bacterium]|nr:methicillin resistance protein [candidate division KSB1 bacterium]